MGNGGKALGWEGQGERGAASSSRAGAVGASGLGERLPRQDRASAVGTRGTREKGVRGPAPASTGSQRLPARATSAGCQCPDPTAQVKKIVVQLQDKALAELHPDLKLLEQVHARQALLVLNESSEVWDDGAATLTVEELFFAFAREKGTRTEHRGGATAAKSVGHQDIRRFRFEKYSESVPPGGTATGNWTRLSGEAEKTGVPSSGQRVACGIEQKKFLQIHARAVSTIDFFDQVLSAIDPNLLALAQTKLTALRERVAAWTPIDHACTQQPTRRREVHPPKDKITVTAELLEEKALRRGEGPPALRPMAFKLAPIHFKHAQPKAPGQTKDVLENESELRAVEKTLGELLAAVEASSGPGIKLAVYGYADSTGNPDGSGAKSNYDLSERRANWVIRQLGSRLKRNLGDVLQAHPCGDVCAPDKGRASPPHRAVLIAEASPS
jgi:hypothetical protein